MKIAGKFRARSAVGSGEVGVAGFAETNLGIKATKISVESGSRARARCIGNEVIIGKGSGILLDAEKSWAGQIATLRLIGKMTRVEDIYAKYARLGRVSASRRVFAEVVEVEEGAIADEIQYTDEIKGPLGKDAYRKTSGKSSTTPDASALGAEVHEAADIESDPKWNSTRQFWK